MFLVLHTTNTLFIENDIRNDCIASTQRFRTVSISFSVVYSKKDGND